MRSAVAAAAVAPAPTVKATAAVKATASDRAPVEATTGCVGREPPGEVAQALLA